MINIFNLFHKKKDAAPEAPKTPLGKRLLTLLLHAAIVLLVLVIILAVGVFLYARYTKTNYHITFYQETSKKVSQNIRFAVISDLHNREYGKENETLISDLRALAPDFILFAGDTVTKTDEHYEPMLELVSRLSEFAPCYGVLGNHESERIYYHDDKDLPKKFENAGLKLLRNSQELIRVGADTIQLIGVEGTSYGFEEYGGRQFMDQLTVDPSAYSILATHIPILFDKQLTDYSFDLGIAGHVHGGLIRIPKFGGLYSAEEGFFPTYCAGRMTLSNQSPLIISRGMGDSSPYPRINNMPELVVVDINCY